MFRELAATSQLISLEDFNLYVFKGFRGELRDLVTSLSITVEPLPYFELHSHLLTRKFLYKSFFYSFVTVALLLPTSTQASSTFFAQCIYYGSNDSDYNTHHCKGCNRDGWRNNQNTFAGTGKNFYLVNSGGKR